MPTTVEIPGIGQVDFPDDMSEQDIVSAIESKIVPSFVEGKRQEAQSFQDESAKIMENAPKTWLEQVEERPGQQKRVPITTIAPSVAIPWPNLEAAPTIPSSPVEPLIPLPRYQISEDDSTAKMVAKSVANFGIGMPEFMTSTLGIASLPAAAAAPNVVGAIFSADMLRTVARDAPDLYENWDSLSKEEKIDGLVNAIGATTLGSLLGVKAAKGFKKQYDIKNNLREAADKYGLPTRAQWAQMQHAQVPLPPVGTSAQSTFTPSLRPQAPAFSQVFTVGNPPSAAPAKPVVVPPVVQSAKPISDAPVLLKESTRVAELDAKVPVGAPEEPSAVGQPSVSGVASGRVESAVGAPTPAAEPPTGTVSPREPISQESRGGYAIKERSAEALPVGEGTRGGEAMVEEVRRAEEPSVPQETKPTEVQPIGQSQAEVAKQDIPRFDQNNGPFYVEYGTRSRGNKYESFDDSEDAIEFHRKQQKKPSVDHSTLTDAAGKEYEEPPQAAKAPAKTGRKRKATVTATEPTLPSAATRAPEPTQGATRQAETPTLNQQPVGSAEGTLKEVTRNAEEAQVQEVSGATQGPAAGTLQAPATKIQAPPASTTLPTQTGTPTQAQPVLSATGPQPFTPAALKTPRSKRLGIVAGQPLPQIDSTFTKIKNWVSKYFTAPGLRPKSLFELEQRMGFEKTMYSRQMERLTSDLRKALRRAYGISGVRESLGGFRNLPDADVRLMDEYLKGNVYNPSVVPAEIRGVLDNMRAVVDGLSTELANMFRARAATMPRAQAQRMRDLADQILQNRNHYLHRSYAFFDSKLNATEWFQQMPEHIRLAAESYVQATTGMGAPVSQLEAQAILTRWLSDLKSVVGNVGDGTSKLGSKDLSVLIKRKSIPDPIRALMGEYTDPMINFTKTVSKLAQHVSSQKFLNDARDAGLRDGWLFKDRDAPPGFTEQIAGPGSDAMNPLSGMRTSPEIAEIFVEHMQQMRESNPVIRMYYRLNAMTKFAATGQSMMGQMRNLMGQPLFWGMAGHWDVGAIRTAVSAMREEIFRRGDAGQRAYLDEASRYGLFGDTVRSAELEAVLKDSDFQTVAPEKLTDWSIGRMLKRYGVTELARIYRVSDELGKLVGWEAEKKNVANVNPSWNADQVATEAARRIRNFYPTYSMVPKAIQSMRRLPIGPFVSFAYEAVRTSGHAIAQSASELRSSNPVERRIGAKRLASQLTTLAAPTAISALTAYMFGVSGEEQDDFRLFQAPWAKNSAFAWLPGQPGERNTINLSYLNPYQYTDVLRAALSGIQDDKPVVDLVANTLKEALSPYLSEQLMATAMLDVARNQTDSGYRVYNPQDTMPEKITKVLNHLAMPLAPGTVQRAIKRTIPSFYESETPYGRKLVPAREVARELSGISMDGFDYKTGLGRGARQYSEASRDAELKFRSPLFTGKPMTEEEMLDVFVTADEARKRNWSDLRLKYLAALRRGVPIEDAVRSLLDNGLGKQDAESVVAGIYIPYEVSEQVYSKALGRKKKLPMEQIERYRGSVIQQQLEQPRP